MTHAQWLLEAEVIRRREEYEEERLKGLVAAVFESSAKALRQVIVQTMGLYLGAGQDQTSDELKFKPMVVYLARPDLLKAMVENAEIETKRLTPGYEEAEDLALAQLSGMPVLGLPDDLGDMEPMLPPVSTIPDEPRPRSNLTLQQLLEQQDNQE